MKEIVRVRKWKSLSLASRNTIIRRSQTDIETFNKKVIPIVDEVKKNGDIALVKYNKKFDNVDIPSSKLRVKDSEFKFAEESLSSEIKKSIQHSFRNVKKYHQFFIKNHNIPFRKITQGVLIGEKITPIDSVGLYVPRSKKVFPSMVYMLGIPAQLANVPRRVMVTPPNQNGTIDPACLYIAKLCEIHEVYKVGGAQAIAALTFGTKTIAPVVKIIGPGSSFVSAAKKYVGNYVDIGLPAGPSESIIIADGSTPAELVAYDLCIEAEHGEDSMALVLTHKKEYAHQISRHLNKIITESPPSQRNILISVFKKYAGIILTDTDDETFAISNTIAPEHLMIHSEAPSTILSHITNAGEVLLGSNSPFSLANYATGANAILPTGGLAKSHSAVSIDDFLKRSSIIRVTEKGLQTLSPSVRTLANYEGFYFHEKALAIRQQNIKPNSISKKNQQK